MSIQGCSSWWKCLIPPCFRRSRGHAKQRDFTPVALTYQTKKGDYAVRFASVNTDCSVPLPKNMQKRMVISWVSSDGHKGQFVMKKHQKMITPRYGCFGRKLKPGVEVSLIYLLDGHAISEAVTVTHTGAIPLPESTPANITCLWSLREMPQSKPAVLDPQDRYLYVAPQQKINVEL